MDELDEREDQHATLKEYLESLDGELCTRGELSFKSQLKRSVNDHLKDLLKEFVKNEGQPLCFRNPYRGLEEYGIEDGEFFFGREREKGEILKRLDSSPDLGLLFIQGPSGVGKSSLLQAGVLYELLGPGAGSQKNYVSYSLFCPGNAGANPFLACVYSIANSSPALSRRKDALISKLSSAAKEGLEPVSGVLDELLDLVLQPHASGKCILAVNQLEELWTLASKHEEAFLNLLAAAAVNPRMLVLATIRDDFVTKFTNSPQITRLIQGGRTSYYPLSGPAVEQIDDMIRKPMEASGYRNAFESGFISRVAADAARLQESALPVVSLLMDTLWGHCKDKVQTPGCFTIKDYLSVGPLDKIIGKLAEDAKNRAKATPEIWDKLFSRLIKFRKRVPVQESRDAQVVMPGILRAELIGDDSELEELVENLAAARLVHVSGEGDQARIRIAHDSLSRSWEDLKDWITRNELHLFLGEEMLRAAESWAYKGRRQRDLIMDSEKLQEYEELSVTREMLFEDHPVASEFLQQCKIRRQREMLILAVKGGHLSYAVRAAKKLRALGFPELLREEDKGTKVFQLAPQFWAAVTGEDRPDEEFFRPEHLSHGETERDSSIFLGEEGARLLKTTTSHGMTPLFWAAAFGRTELLKKMVALGADPHVLREFDSTILHEVACGGDVEMLRFLVEKQGVDPLKADDQGNLPLLWALQEKQREVADYLAERGQSFNCTCTVGWNALTEAARADDLQRVTQLIDIHGYDPNAKAAFGLTPLHVACGNDRADTAEVADALIDTYNSSLIETTDNGLLPLHIAAGCGKDTAIDVLVPAGKAQGLLHDMLEAGDMYGDTPLHRACFWQHSLSVEKLLNAGADPNTVDSEGRSPLFFAVGKGDRRSAQALLNKGARTEIIPDHRWSALHLAIGDGDLDMLERLLKHTQDRDFVGEVLAWARKKTGLEEQIKLLEAWIKEHTGTPTA